jgi:hypothetical protein
MPELSSGVQEAIQGAVGWNGPLLAMRVSGYGLPPGFASADCDSDFR